MERNRDQTHVKGVRCLEWNGLALLLLLAVWGLTHWYRAPRVHLHQCRENLKMIEQAIFMYSTDYGGRIPGSACLSLSRDGCRQQLLLGLVPAYLKAMPTCPAAGRDTYSEGYRNCAGCPYGGLYLPSYILTCRGSNHEDAGMPRNFPVLTSLCGELVLEQPSGPRRPWPFVPAVDGVRLGDTAETVRNVNVDFHHVGRWGWDDDDTFLPSGPYYFKSGLMYADGRVCMVRGATLDLGTSVHARGSPLSKVLSVLGPPDWKADLGAGYQLMIYKRDGISLTISGKETLDFVMACRPPREP